jgi:hypothetical protein
MLPITRQVLCLSHARLPTKYLLNPPLHELLAPNHYQASPQPDLCHSGYVSDSEYLCILDHSHSLYPSSSTQEHSSDLAGVIKPVTVRSTHA